MKIRIALLVIAFAAFPAAVPAQQPSAESGVITSTAPGKVGAGAVTETTLVVESIDKATRHVTLKGPGGNSETIVAGDEVRNFDQIRVGDQVVVRYTEALALELKKTKGGTPSIKEQEHTSRAKLGEKPAGTVTKEVTVVANVESVDASTQTVTLRGPKQTVRLKVQDPEQFKNIKKGDQVEATYTESIAISVQAAPAKDKK